MKAESASKARFIESVLFERRLTRAEQCDVSHFITDMRDEIHRLRSVADAAKAYLKAKTRDSQMNKQIILETALAALEDGDD